MNDNKKKTIILVADIKGWAFDNIAKYIQSLLSDNYELHILYSGEYKDYSAFLNHLNSFEKIDFIHFFYRGYLTEFLNVIAKLDQVKNKAAIDKFLNIACVTNIPDHLFLRNNQEMMIHTHMFNFVDNYYPVSQILFDIYNNISFYPKPWKVIYDNIEVKQTKPDFTSNSEKLVVTWVGNSMWGEWQLGIGYDSKGFKSIVLPTFDLLKQEGIQIEEYVVDGNIINRTKDEVFAILKKTDILLIGAKTEGTPLPLIEAIANGCAIISTDVGIVRETLPKIQHSFIVDHDKYSFIEKIKLLNNDRALLKKLKEQNYEVFLKLFNNKDHFKNLWTSLIEDSINKLKTENRIDIKQKILHNIGDSKIVRSNSFGDSIYQYIKSKQFLKRLAIYLYKFSIVRSLLRKIVSFIQFFQSKNFIVNFSNNISNIILNKNDSLIVLYSTFFPGVANSTIKLFDQLLPLPTSYFIERFGLPTRQVKILANAIIQTKVKNLIFSGGNVLAIQLIELLDKKKYEHKINIYFLWHGSPAQWESKHHSQNFYKWHKLYKEKKIKAIITLKKDLEKVLHSHDINSFLLQNFAPGRPKDIIISGKKDIFRIGVWSAYKIWVKNLHPQLISINMFNNKIICHTNFKFDKHDSWILEHGNYEIFPEKIPHNELMNLIANTDLTLYVTNTECSPMIALESLSLGVPCLVGPTSGLFDDDLYLKEMLTVNRVDCSYAIYSAIKKVQENYDDIKSRIPAFIVEYNERATILKENLINEINKLNKE